MAMTDSRKSTAPRASNSPSTSSSFEDHLMQQLQDMKKKNKDLRSQNASLQTDNKQLSTQYEMYLKMVSGMQFPAVEGADKVAQKVEAAKKRESRLKDGPSPSEMRETIEDLNHRVKVLTEEKRSLQDTIESMEYQDTQTAKKSHVVEEANAKFRKNNARSSAWGSVWISIDAKEAAVPAPPGAPTDNSSPSPTNTKPQNQRVGQWGSLWSSESPPATAESQNVAGHSSPGNNWSKLMNGMFISPPASRTSHEQSSNSARMSSLSSSDKDNAAELAEIDRKYGSSSPSRVSAISVTDSKRDSGLSLGSVLEANEEDEDEDAELQNSRESWAAMQRDSLTHVLDSAGDTGSNSSAAQAKFLETAVKKKPKTMMGRVSAMIGGDSDPMNRDSINSIDVNEQLKNISNMDGFNNLRESELDGANVRASVFES